MGAGGYEGGPQQVEFSEDLLPLPVDVDGISITKFNVDGSITNIPASTKSTILTQAFVAGSFENLIMVSVSATNYAKFFLTKNGADIDIKRTGPGLNEVFDFTGAPYGLVTGDIIDIKAEHFTGGLVDFDATIYGYD